MKDKIIFQKNGFRIVEVSDTEISFEDLCGDSYCHKSNPDIDPEKLKKEKLEFLALVNDVGVFGYMLEKWNPEVGIGWAHVDSCHGFIGAYNPEVDRFDHYIIEELKDQIGMSKKDMNNLIINFLNSYIDDAFKGAFSFYLENENVSEDDESEIIELLDNYVLTYKVV
jgi:hypothetical protein